MDFMAFERSIARIGAVDSDEELDQVFLEICQKRKLDYYSFLLISPISFVDPEVMFLSNFPDNLKKLYQERSCYSKDTIVSNPKSISAPIIWSNENESMDEDCFSRFKIESYNQGIKSGVSVCARISLFFGVFSLASSYSITESENLLKESMPHLGGLINAVISTAVKLYKKNSLGGIYFTKREEECLIWATEGKTTWETSKIVGISERTVIYHLQNVSDKLGVHTRQHAIAKAISLGLVSPQI